MTKVTQPVMMLTEYDGIGRLGPHAGRGYFYRLSVCDLSRCFSRRGGDLLYEVAGAPNRGMPW